MFRQHWESENRLQAAPPGGRSSPGAALAAVAADRLGVAVALLDDQADVGLHQLGDVHHLQTEGEPLSFAAGKKWTGRCGGESGETNHLRFEEQLSALHGNLVSVGQRRPERQDLLVGENLQWPRLAPLVDGDGFPAHAQPQLAGEGGVPTLRRRQDTAEDQSEQRNLSTKRSLTHSLESKLINMNLYIEHFFI